MGVKFAILDRVWSLQNESKATKHKPKTSILQSREVKKRRQCDRF